MKSNLIFPAAKALAERRGLFCHVQMPQWGRLTVIYKKDIKMGNMKRMRI